MEGMFRGRLASTRLYTTLPSPILRSSPSPILRSSPSPILRSITSIHQSRCFSHTPIRKADRPPPPPPKSNLSDFLNQHMGESPKSSLDDLSSLFGPSRYNPNRPARDTDTIRDPDYVRSMLDPKDRAQPKPVVLPQPLNAYGPSVGKTVFVDPARGMDVGKAFNALGATLTRNGVRRDVQMQKFHERPGLKRKRLHSQRWRRRFKIAFKDMVSTVTHMRKQGW